MGHEGFYNFLLVTMGNVVSALLMYALQAAWLCQRLIDQDYRQNHGSRPTPISDGKEASKPLEILTSPSEILLSKSGNQKIHRCSKQVSSKSRRLETMKTAERSVSGESRRRKFGRRQRTREDGETEGAEEKLHVSHPYLENGRDSLTLEYMNGLDEALGLRRAFSDINVSTSWLEFKQEFCSKNQNCLTGENVNTEGTNRISVTDKDFVSLIFANSYVT